MSLWIRSQDKRFLVECNDVGFKEIDKDFVISTYSVQTVKGGVKLGIYSTQEKALKVLDYIETFLNEGISGTFPMPLDSEVG